MLENPTIKHEFSFKSDVKITQGGLYVYDKDTDLGKIYDNQLNFIGGEGYGTFYFLLCQVDR